MYGVTKSGMSAECRVKWYSLLFFQIDMFNFLNIIHVMIFFHLVKTSSWGGRY